MHVRVAPLVLVASLLFSASCASINGPRGGRMFMPPSNQGAKLQFNRIKALEGDWAWSPELAPDLTGLVVTYQVTSAGSAVVETMFPDDQYEMVTVYHLDGEQLVMTHYSSAGNQPTMRAEPGEPDGPIHFEYIGATNLRSMNTGHMHRTSFLVTSEDELLTSWTFYEDQKSSGDRIFRLTRVHDEPQGDEPEVARETGVRGDLLEQSAIEGESDAQATLDEGALPDGQLPEGAAGLEELVTEQPVEADPVVDPEIEDPDAGAAEGTPPSEDDGAAADAELEAELEAELNALEEEIEEDVASESDDPPTETRY